MDVENGLAYRTRASTLTREESNLLDERGNFKGHSHIANLSPHTGIAIAQTRYRLVILTLLIFCLAQHVILKREKTFEKNSERKPTIIERKEEEEIPSSSKIPSSSTLNASAASHTLRASVAPQKSHVLAVVRAYDAQANQLKSLVYSLSAMSTPSCKNNCVEFIVVPTELDSIRPLAAVVAQLSLDGLYIEMLKLPLAFESWEAWFKWAENEAPSCSESLTADEFMTALCEPFLAFDPNCLKKSNIEDQVR